MRIRGIFSIFLQYFKAEANLEEENTSNLIPPPPTEFFLIPAKVTSRVTGVTLTFSTCALVSCVVMSALHSRTLPQGPWV